MSVRNYHYTRRNGFTCYGWSNKNKSLVPLSDAGARLLIGYELEKSFNIDWNADADEYLDDISDEMLSEVGDYIGTESDSSVDDGFEIVSMPMTIQAHVKSDWIDRLCGIINSHDPMEGDNGMHVHISRAGLGTTVKAQDLAIAKMALMLELHSDKFYDLARRDYEESGWAYPIECKQYALHSRDLSRAVRNTDDSRYHSINLTNSNTVEFRIFADTSSAHIVKATLELVHAVATYCMTHTLDVIRDGSFYSFAKWAITSGKYMHLPEYLLERNCIDSYDYNYFTSFVANN